MGHIGSSLSFELFHRGSKLHLFIRSQIIKKSDRQIVSFRQIIFSKCYNEFLKYGSKPPFSQKLYQPFKLFFRENLRLFVIPIDSTYQSGAFCSEHSVQEDPVLDFLGSISDQLSVFYFTSEKNKTRFQKTYVHFLHAGYL